MAEQISLRLYGTEDNPTMIGGAVYCGGNSATIHSTETNKVELKIGSYVIADKVFMGNNGENMVKEDILQLYAGHVNNDGELLTNEGELLTGEDDGIDFSTINLKDKTQFAKYMDGVAMSLKPSIVTDSKENGDPEDYLAYKSYIGSFYLGGNVGSMTYPGTYTMDFSEPIVAYTKIVGGCNKAIVEAGPKKKKECRDLVFEHMAFVLRDVFEAYNRSVTALGLEMQNLQATITKQNEIVETIQGELRDLRSQTVETETAIANINTMLLDAGFQGFVVRPHNEVMFSEKGAEVFLPQPPLHYEVVRTDTGLVATDLSEGEKNFLAFLYFQQRVFGSETSDGDDRQKIVVIDDPVSSMDSSALFIIGEQVRKMIEICRNNADNRGAVMKGNFIKQIFILTHNAYFHREITYPHAHRYEFVSFYLVKKRENRSSVDLKRRRDPDCPTEWMNVNPVKNSYAALWDEYKELKDVTSAIPLINVIRRILEYYFLQICGYDGSQLRRTILEEHKPDLTHDADGNEDYTKFDMATTMLSYIAATTYGVNDGLHYVDDVIDIEQCRETFREIFHHMDQEQHYKMMMSIK